METRTLRSCSTIAEDIARNEPYLSGGSLLSGYHVGDSIHLERDHGHLWSVVLSQFYDSLPWLNEVLSVEERQRAERFYFRKDRDRYVIGHGIRRVILGSYLRQPASSITFCYGKCGKPQVKFISDELNFSDSRSGDLAVYAITRACPIGIDVERVRFVPQYQEIASRFFSRQENDMIMALPLERRMERFFTIWSGKEAYLKATGDGIGGDLAKVEVVDLSSSDGVSLIRVLNSVDSTAQWQLRSYSPIPGYRAVVAVRDHTLLFSEHNFVSVVPPKLS